MSNQEARRIQWTQAKFLNMWFNTWEKNLITLGFAMREDGAKGISIPPDQLVRILNFDETALSLDGSGTSAGGRPKAVFYNPNLPLVGKATLKESACTMMIMRRGEWMRQNSKNTSAIASCRCSPMP